MVLFVAMGIGAAFDVRHGVDIRRPIAIRAPEKRATAATGSRTGASLFGAGPSNGDHPGLLPRNQIFSNRPTAEIQSAPRPTAATPRPLRADGAVPMRRSPSMVGVAQSRPRGRLAQQRSRKPNASAERSGQGSRQRPRCGLALTASTAKVGVARAPNRPAVRILSFRKTKFALLSCYGLYLSPPFPPALARLP
jgi:hypothetical protein